MDNEKTESESSARKSEGARVEDRVLRTGESFGNFRVVKCLTAGLMANYYHMQHVRDLHDVTVAIFHRRTIKDGECLKRLQVLQKTLKAISHESIPKIEDSAVINGRHCLFLEPIRGISLSQYFEQHGIPGERGIHPDRAVDIMSGLLGLLGFAHSHGVDHRDLNSDLIYIHEDGRIQVLGFGIKATLGVDLFESIVSASVSPLEHNQAVGRLNSFDIMSPEYKHGVVEDHRVDIYAVGVLGYWLLCAQKPELEKWAVPSTVVENLPRGLDTFFGTSLENDPNARFRSCKLALHALKETEAEPEVEAVGFFQRQLNRIFVPESILGRGSFAVRAYHISLLVIVGLALGVVALWVLSMVRAEMQPYVRNVATEALPGQYPDLRITVQPDVAKIQFIHFEEKFSVSGGELNLLVQPGQYRVRVSAAHHLEQVLPLLIPNDSEEPIELEVALSPAYTDLMVTTEPGAALTAVNERKEVQALGVADEAGVLFLEKGIVAGSYQIIAEKAGYEKQVLMDREVVFGEMNKMELPLQALPSSLTVRTNPSGARVLIDEVEVGLSPVSTSKVVPGDAYVIAVQLDGYRSIGRRIEVGAGKEEVVDFGDLQPHAGELAFDVSFVGAGAAEAEAFMAELTVELDGVKLVYGASELKAVGKGLHRIRLEHPLYVSELQQINIKDRETVTVVAQLMPRPGLIELRIPEAYETSVRLNGIGVALVDDMVQIPAKETVEFELRIKNHLTMVRRFNLSPNERYVWEVEPVAIPSPVMGKGWTMPYLGLDLAWIEPSAFNMGSLPSEPGRLANEGPQTWVRFTRGFWMGVHEVTQAQYGEVVGRNPSEFSGAQKPVENVTWKDAKAYCVRLTQLEKEAGRLPEGYVYRLPTEAEWEYAARAGTKTPFSFGERADASMGNFRGVYPEGNEGGLRVADTYGTREVGSFKPNAYGLYDMHGNAQEWTLDYYNGRLAGGVLTDPVARVEGRRIAVRGGNWEQFATKVRSASRDEYGPETKSNALGFRVVLAPEL